MNWRKDCIHFNGYKPCGYNTTCDVSCPAYSKRGPRILFIHLGALGAVVRSTALLSLIHENYPGAEITWVTAAPAQNLLRGHPLLKRVLTTQHEDLLCLNVLEFDQAFVIDKSLEATGVLKKTKVLGSVLGFLANTDGIIEPANAEALELWELGLSNFKKFFENQKSEIQLMKESLKLSGEMKGYNLPLNQDEKKYVSQLRQSWLSDRRNFIIGINTGCAPTLPNKKLSIQNHRDLILRINKTFPEGQVVLLGGPEDTERNRLIAENRDVLLSDTEKGLRNGLCSVAASDIIISGDSLGMHMAISQNRPVIVWFGPSCHQEIELFGYGEKVLTKAECSPCWKRSCNEKVMCYDQVDLTEIMEALHRQIRKYKTQDQLCTTDSISG